MVTCLTYSAITEELQHFTLPTAKCWETWSLTSQYYQAEAFKLHSSYPNWHSAQNSKINSSKFCQNIFYSNEAVIKFLSARKTQGTSHWLGILGLWLGILGLWLDSYTLTSSSFKSDIYIRLCCAKS